jgi:hypothetical protein|nr:MAG TPA: repressor protein C2 [Caudoviricetes sp.]
MNIEKLKALFEKSPDKYGDAKQMGTTYQSLYNLIYKGSTCKVDLLERIAAFYRVPVGYFFDEVNLTQITASGMQAIATASGAVSVGTKNSVDGDSIGTQYNYTGYDNETRKDTITTLTETVATLTKELDTSQQQKSHLIDVVATSQQQIQQLTTMLDRLTK